MQKSGPPLRSTRLQSTDGSFRRSLKAELKLYWAVQADIRRILDGAKLPKMEAQKEGGRLAKKKRLYGEYQKPAGICRKF